MPKVSIIIPFYNNENFLERSVSSAINQTLSDIEIICVNDGSTDNSEAIIKKYMHKDKRIKYIKNENNSGAAFARNMALAVAKGEFIGFIDSDDYVDKKYFENLYAQSKDFDIIRGIRLVNGKQAINKYGCLVPSIIRRTVLIKNKLEFPLRKTGEDSTLKRWLYKKTNKILEVADNGIYYYYEKREGSLSNYSFLEKHTDNELENPISSK